MNLKQVGTFMSVICVAVVAVAVLRAPKRPVDDCGFVQNIYGQRISWKTKSAIPLHIDDSVPIELRPAIYRAAKTWENYIGRQIFDISENSTNSSGSQGQSNKNSIYFLKKWESDKVSEQGRTNVIWAGDEIQKADIRINAANFRYYNLSPLELKDSLGTQTDLAKADGYSFEALILHEMGHFLGLKHREDQGTVMATHLGAFVNRTQLAISDQSSIACEYKVTKNRFSFLN